MKERKGFVSNSSSSSFVIPLNRLTLEQRSKIRNHSEEARDDAWNVRETDTEMQGWTYMDNFDMMEFLQKIGVPMDCIQEDGGHYWCSPFDEDETEDEEEKDIEKSPASARSTGMSGKEAIFDDLGQYTPLGKEITLYLKEILNPAFEKYGKRIGTELLEYLISIQGHLLGMTARLGL